MTKAASENTQLSIALAYAKQGIKVFPCNSKKRPTTENGFKDATTDPEQIRSWWTGRGKNSLVAAPNDQFTVIDVDSHGISETIQILVDTAVNRLRSADVIGDTTPHVRTMSGGSHYYFQRDLNITRMIHALPSIDILADGGYVILPDQKKYTCTTSDTPWDDTFGQLPELNLDALMSVVEGMTEITKQSKALKKEYRATKSAEVAYAPVKKKKDTRDLTGIPTKKGTNDVELVSSEEKAVTHSVDYRTGKMSFEEDSTIYDTAESPTHDDTFEVEFDENGYLKLGDTKLNSGVINTLFHTPEIQKRIGRFMGLDVPTQGHTKVQRSIFPKHIDTNPSMGVRWSQDNTHLIVRDFANHYGSKHKNVDFNIVRLFATCRYDALVPRMNSPEFVVWFCRLMVDAKILDVSDTMKKFDGIEKSKNVTPAVMKVANGILLLDAIKQKYEGYDGITVYADKFCAAWNKVDPSTGNRAKATLVENGFLKVEGMFDCSAGRRKDGFFQTRLLSIVENRKVFKSPLFDEELRKELNSKRKQNRENKNHEMRELLREETMTDTFTTITSVEMPVSEATYQTLLNFAEDFNIPNVPPRRNCVVLVGGGFGAHNPKLPDTTTTKFLADDVTPTVLDKMSGEGKILMLTAESPAIEELAYQISKTPEFNQEDTMFMGEPLIGVVLSNDFEPPENFDPEFLRTKIWEYLENGVLEFDSLKIRYLDRGDYNFIMDGVEPTQDGS